jgi:hypothetical protein
MLGPKVPAFVAKKWVNLGNEEISEGRVASDKRKAS